jgi:shikimate 5-dehydrogenase
MQSSRHPRKEISMSDAKSQRLSRRHFLLAVGAGGAATAAAVVAGKSGKAVSVPAQGNDKRRGKGYEETAHVRSYYNTTKV